MAGTFNIFCNPVGEQTLRVDGTWCAGTISPSSANGAILGGSNNCIGAGANYSSILGGSGNVIPAGFNYISIFGCNVTGVLNCAMHVNQLVVQNMPTGIGLNPPGTLWYNPADCIVRIVI